MDLLVSWIQSPDPNGIRDVGRALPFFLAARAQQRGTIVEGAGLDLTALGLLDGQNFVQSGATAWSWHSGSLIALTRMIQETRETGVAVVLDDDDSAVETGITESWRTWLQLSNLLGLRATGTQVTVRSLVAGASTRQPELEVLSGEDAPPPDAPWTEVIAQATAEERPFLALLAQDGLPVPEYGPEVCGIPLGPSWLDRRITVDVDLGDSERSDLATLGWTVVAMDVDEVRDALSAGDS